MLPATIVWKDGRVVLVDQTPVTAEVTEDRVWGPLPAAASGRG